jgi:hypothetical protein
MQNRNPLIRLAQGKCPKVSSFAKNLPWCAARNLGLSLVAAAAQMAAAQICER